MKKIIITLLLAFCFASISVSAKTKYDVRALLLPPDRVSGNLNLEIDMHYDVEEKSEILRNPIVMLTVKQGIMKFVNATYMSNDTKTIYDVKISVYRHSEASEKIFHEYIDSFNKNKIEIEVQSGIGAKAIKRKNMDHLTILDEEIIITIYALTIDDTLKGHFSIFTTELLNHIKEMKSK